MDVITTQSIETLIEHADPPCVSIYLPTHRAGPEIQQDPIRLGNLLDEAEERLLGLGLRRPEVEAITRGARSLLVDREFWRYQEEGLAVFMAPGRFQFYRLPHDFDELVVVTDAFHVKPLTAFVSEGDRFSILALSRNEVRLLWADRFRVGEIDLPGDIPTSLAEALWFEDRERQLQNRGQDRVGRGRVTAVFHGHGSPDEKDDARLARFLRAVDGGVRQLIPGDEPLVLAGVEDVVATYREVSDHGSIPDEAVAGSPDRLSEADLHGRALAIIEPLLHAREEQTVDRYRAAGDLAVSSLEEVVTAAIQGRVDELFVQRGTEVWGRVGSGGTEVRVHEERQIGDRDLLDVATAAAWSTGASVHLLDPDEVPADGPLAALLRF